MLKIGEVIKTIINALHKGELDLLQNKIFKNELIKKLNEW